jgi:hypothetical protein
VGLARSAVALVALASIGLGVARVWPELGRQHARYATFSTYEIRHAGALHEHLDPQAFDYFRVRVGGRQRYYIDANFIYRTFAVEWLLPAVPAVSPAKADVTLRWPAS